MSKPDENDINLNSDEASFDFSDFDFDSDMSEGSDVAAHDMDLGAGLDTHHDSTQESEPIELEIGDSEFGSSTSDAVDDLNAAPASAVLETPTPTAKKGKKEKPPKAVKEKPVKVKKEKPPKAPKQPKQPRDPNAPGLQLEDMAALGACALLAVVFIALNALVFLNGGLGGSNIMFLIFMDLIALVVVAVPFMIFKYRQTVSLFEVGLGVAVVAVSLGAILLLAEMWRYDYKINKARSAQKPAQLSIQIW